MSQFKRSGLVLLQVLVAVVTVAATVVVLAHPACVAVMLHEVVRAVLATLLLFVVRVLVGLSRPAMVCQSVWCWWWYARAVLRRELRYSLVAGFLLGLVLGVWACLAG